MVVSTVVIGTRKSKLALQQTNLVRQALLSVYPKLIIEIKEIITRGDTTLNASLPSLGGKGLFTAELEGELLTQSIDIAVHSLKDLPTEQDARFVLGALLARESSRDVLVSHDGLAFSDLPPGAVIGTSSPRRESQLRKLRSDLIFKDIRGNVDTRIRKVRLGEYAATVLAEAGLARLALLSEAVQFFTPQEMMPAPGQGTLAVQCAAHRQDIVSLLQKINNLQACVESEAERTFLATLGAGCSTPVGARATFDAGKIALQTRCLSHDGKHSIDLSGECAGGNEPVAQAIRLGAELATQALAQGFKSLL